MHHGSWHHAARPRRQEQIGRLRRWPGNVGVVVLDTPVVGLVVALPMHWMGHFNYDWTSHLGPIYLGTIIYVVGAGVALLGLTLTALRPRPARHAIQDAWSCRPF